jgi:uncharacterized protein
VARIDGALDALAREERVAILFAVESGSRAWDFASPDSDWDVRFVYARPTSWHLSLEPGRDTLERMLPGDLDLAGWDARKAILLLLSGNAVLREWLRSPVIYRADPGMFGAFRDLAAAVSARPACIHHYRNLMRRQWDRELADGAEVKLKRYLYAVRPALALRWMAQHAAGDPPMALPALLAETELPREAREALEGLVATKRQASELGRGPCIPLLDRLITEELAAMPGGAPAPLRDPAWRLHAEALFRSAVAFADRTVEPEAA